MNLLLLYDIFGSATTRINLFVQLIDLLGTFTVYYAFLNCVSFQQKTNLFLFQVYNKTTQLAEQSWP